MTAINLSGKLSKFSEHWSPNIITDFNGHDVMVVKVEGEFNYTQNARKSGFWV